MACFERNVQIQKMSTDLKTDAKGDSETQHEPLVCPPQWPGPLKPLDGNNATPPAASSPSAPSVSPAPSSELREAACTAVRRVTGCAACSLSVVASFSPLSGPQGLACPTFSMCLCKESGHGSCHQWPPFLVPEALGCYGKLPY